ncbi:MAG: hypothetical protein DWP95_04170 [Proteobacteria bacterium]|nr:MAG: hypothetical protein DWP95_04170 [Pseudomonadota bacterium]
MDKSKSTLIKLESALDRICKGNTKNIPEYRKLSVRAVEQEALLGDGTAYYYPDFIKRIKNEVTKSKLNPSEKTKTKPLSSKKKLANEKRIKENYRDKLKDANHLLSKMAASTNELAYALHQAHNKISQLEKEIVKLKRNKITSIKK